MGSSNRVAQAISILFGAYGKADDLNRQAIYSEFFKEIPSEILEPAIKKLIVEKTFLPTISEIVDATKEVVSEQSSTPRIKDWDEAWREIWHALRVYSYLETPKFSTPEIAAAVETIGWYTLCTCQNSELTTLRAQIREIYKSICARAKTHSTNRYALGHDNMGLLCERGFEPKAEEARFTLQPSTSEAGRELTSISSIISKSRLHNKTQNGGREINE